MSDFNSYPEQDPEFMQIQHLPEQPHDGPDLESMIIRRTEGDSLADMGQGAYRDELITRRVYDSGDEERFGAETHQQISNFWRRELDALAEKARSDINITETTAGKTPGSDVAETAAEGEVLPASEVYQILRFAERATPVERPAFPRTIDSEVTGENPEQKPED